ncbi:DODA-type extradiol aromatic ring-opening family dioxygenase [Geopsychrobacter electrodiphilus]|uniref:DODA-type extradiol aromatic ring-opening family dioxygenase n=1 Tax=Geopsychrobacter electrodiphilus TaxID=225196 RepID=UPI00037B2267|nr:class III extradiol ring-cleavage dioxygenase [Geopsychrobacter electrodiphilus]
MQELPAIFLSHGAPDLVLSQEPARQALIDLGKSLPRPKGILIISAHWQAAQFTLGEALQFSTIYDFGGFPAELYRLTYPAQGAAWLISLCREVLQEGNIDFNGDPQRGLDHGAWIPLMLAWPEAEIPVLSLSLKRGASLTEHLALGRALAPLRKAGVLIVASGAITHNLGKLLPSGSPPEPWVLEFSSWVEEKLLQGASADLLGYREHAPHARLAHPTPEHFEPLLVAYGAGNEQPGTLLHRSFSYGNLAMETFAFGGG